MLKYNISTNLMKNMTIFISDTEPRSFIQKEGAETKRKRKREKEKQKVGGESKVNHVHESKFRSEL